VDGGIGAASTTPVNATTAAATTTKIDVFKGVSCDIGAKLAGGYLFL
jgi:hypothetical protein